MKTVVNTAQVAHLWANQSQSEARNAGRNFYFRGPVIYSYGARYPAAVFSPFTDADGARVVFENGANYSNTTQRHGRHVRDALHGHPVRIVSVPGTRSAFDNCDAERLARGDAATLARIIRTLADKAGETVRAAMRKRSADYAAWSLRSALAMFADCDMLAACGPDKKTRAMLARAIGTRPAIPSGCFTLDTSYGYERWTAAPDFWQRVEPLRAAMRADDARETFAGRNATAAATCWKDARDRKLSARSRLESCDRAASHMLAIWRAAKRGGVALPRTLPTRADVRKLRAALLPVAALEWLRDNAADVRDRRASLVRAYYAGRHALKTDRDAWRPYSDAQRILSERREPKFTAASAAIAAAVNDGDASVTRLPECPELLAAAVALLDDGGQRARDARRMLRDLYAAILEFDKTAEPIAYRIARHDKRASLEESAHAAERAIGEARALLTGAGDVRAEYAGAHIDGAINRATRYAFEYSNAPSDLRGGLPAVFDTSDLAANRSRAILACSAKRARTLGAEYVAAMNRGIECRNAGRMFSAAEAFSEARELATQYMIAFEYAGRLASEIGAPWPGEFAMPCEPQHAQDSARFARGLTAETIHGRGESFAVECWRRGDNAARSGFLYRAAPRFRVAANGQEIESSMGARVSVAAGRLLWRMIRRAVQSGAAMQWDYGRGPHIGSFQARTIRADGSAVIGCHEITAQEARDFAAFMEWPPIDAPAESDETDNAA